MLSTFCSQTGVSILMNSHFIYLNTYLFVANRSAPYRGSGRIWKGFLALQQILWFQRSSGT